MLHDNRRFRPHIAVLVPCYNEEATIADVVTGFRLALPNAAIHVYDNNSTDRTAQLARESGAIVSTERRQGKGHVVRRMFADIEADIYVMADGDGTYDPADAVKLVDRLVADGLDMVVGTRAGVHKDAGRAGHAFGNRLFNRIYQVLFGRDFTDILSGYRAFSRRYVKSFPAISAGFEIETEMSVHAGQLKLPVAEIELRYGRRPDGSQSKLSTYRDGARILVMFARLMKETRPTRFFGFFAAMFFTASVVFMVPPIVEYLTTGLVERIPMWIGAVGMMVLSMIFSVCGMILTSVAKGRVELKRMVYLATDTRSRWIADTQASQELASR